MDILQFMAAILVVVAPLFTGLGYVMKRYSDGRYHELETRLRITSEESTGELEKVKADTAQSLSASESIKSLTGTLVTMVEERRESTVAIKENTAAMTAMTGTIDIMDSGRGEAMSLLTGAMTTLTTTVNETLLLLVRSVSENTEVLRTVSSGQDDMEVLFEALRVVVNRLKFDNKRFAEFILRPTDDSRQGIEDIATGQPDEPALVTLTT